ncbi:MAG TPA: hypothetical protein VMQ51_17550 [Candidatus Binatia bacterium]|nr:hypothetical protein [Candidatus Binatia bacterium]
MSPTPSAAPERTPAALHERALADLQFIRRTMEGAAAFTTLSGAGLVAIGVSALGAAVLAGSTPGAAWLGVWVAEAALGLMVGVLATLWKTRRAQLPLLSGPLRKFGLALAAPSLAGAVLTLALAQQGSYALLPGVWLLLYGSGLLAGGTFSIRLVPVMGGCFMALGVAAALAPAGLGAAAMAAGFGGLHLVFGALVMRGHGG